MSPADQGAAERYGRERVPRVAEGREEEAAPRAPVGARMPTADCRLPAQTSSATARIISLRPSTVQAIGVIISVPTPASR